MFVRSDSFHALNDILLSYEKHTCPPIMYPGLKKCFFLQTFKVQVHSKSLDGNCIEQGLELLGKLHYNYIFKLYNCTTVQYILFIYSLARVLIFLSNVHQILSLVCVCPKYIHQIYHHVYFSPKCPAIVLQQMCLFISTCMYQKISQYAML